ncbi:cytochrome c oxidase subunit 3 [Silvibacterium bohemicum]|uniref:Cytochrome c oxidase subunit 3 n=1 Tax=Silvibacterium bohemicum TaxID=1577686 RepID=A0A841K3X1_9BACT|nr:cytochrome c oxidase subunit 3 [Silvibacterium bohemicum]MBB6146639.1 cytochrome c oxidase subunit 3 [Silvibacterium bohemicum]
MPATFTSHPVEIERKDPGIGGKPPVDRRPTGGGGDGDNWENRPSGRRGPRELLSRYRLGVIFALAGDLMFFVAIVSAFFVRQSAGHFDARENYVSDWHPLAVPPILWLNTAVLLLSTVTVEIARRQLFREIDVMEEWLGLGRPAVKRASPWLIATAVLGVIFLVGQWIAWKQLVLAGFHFDSPDPSSHFFYLITGTHGLHLVLGVLALGGALIGLFTLRRIELRQIVVDCTAWYWHTMGIFWVFLFALLVVFQ